MPEEIRVFEYTSTKGLWEKINYCQQVERGLAARFQDETGFNPKDKPELYFNFWKDHLKSCFGVYKQTSPTFVFKFFNPEGEKYLLSDVQLFLYGSTNSLGVKKNYFSEADEGIESILFDPKRTNTLQVLKFQSKRTYILDEGDFALELNLYTNEFWDGRFDKDRYIIDLIFTLYAPAKDHEVIVKTLPFIVDL